MRKAKVSPGGITGSAAAPSGRTPAAAKHPRRIDGRDADWNRLNRKLTETLGCLEPGHFLILQTRDHEPYYVQVAAGGLEGFRMEAVSNRFLTGWRRLDATAHARLRRLGWMPPTDIGVGPVNWWRCYPQGTPTADMAELAVGTLRKAFDVSRPSGLVYRAFSRGEGDVLLPTLGLARDRGPGPLDDRVDDALRELLEVDEIIRDDDGDRPVRSGDSMVYLRVVTDPSYVAVFSPALLHVSRTPALVEAINDVNHSIRVARAFVTDTTVIFAAEVDDQPDIRASVISAFNAVSSLSNSYGAELQGRFGGHTFFAEPAQAVVPPPEPGCGLYL
jgi:hypothetical protein